MSYAERFSGGIQGGKSNSSQQSIYQADTAGQSTDPPKIRCQTDRFVRILRPRHSDIDFLVELERLTFRDYIGLVLFLEDLFQKDWRSLVTAYLRQFRVAIHLVYACTSRSSMLPVCCQVLLGFRTFSKCKLCPRRSKRYF